MLKRKISKKSRMKEIVQRRMLDSDTRNEVFVLTVLFQQYLFSNEMQCVMAGGLSNILSNFVNL
jgi:hypothetical protein